MRSVLEGWPELERGKSSAPDTAEGEAPLFARDSLIRTGWIVRVPQALGRRLQVPSVGENRTGAGAASRTVGGERRCYVPRAGVKQFCLHL